MLFSILFSILAYLGYAVLVAIVIVLAKMINAGQVSMVVFKFTKGDLLAIAIMALIGILTGAFCGSFAFIVNLISFLIVYNYTRKFK